MRKISLLSALLMLFGLTATAQEYISVGEVLVPQGRQSMLEVRFHFDKGHDYVSYQFTVNLPDGISLVTKSNGKVPVTLGDGQDEEICTLDLNADTHILTCYTNPSTPIGGTDGLLVCIPIQADGDNVKVDDELSGSLTEVEFTHNEGAVRQPFDAASFTIKVTDKIILDENYTWEPFATDEDCDIKVIRTINANEWSTICLPFDIDAAQFKQIFGNDVQLASYTSYKTEKEGTDVIGITLNFEDVDLDEDDFETNTPYLIKTSKKIDEFTITATIEPDDVKVGSKSKGWFIGTYQAGTVVPENSLFLSENKFYYSTGKTKMKGFRAYFTLKDVLADVSQSGARIFLSVGDETTEIHPVQMGTDDDGWYTLSGLKLDKKPAATGVYIHRGEKVVINEERMRK